MRLDQLNVVWEDNFVALREEDAEGFKSRRAAVYSEVNSIPSSKKYVPLVKGNVVYVKGKEIPYHA